MSNLKYPIFKLPEYYMREFEKRELPRYMKWWLYQSYLRKHGTKLSDIITGSNFTLENTVARKFNIFEVGGNTEQTQLTGKNLLGLVDGTYTNNGITAVVSNGKITLNGTATNTSFIPINLLKNIELSNQTVTLSTNNSEIAGDNLTELRVYTSGVDYLACNFSTINKSASFNNKTNIYEKIQIRTSSGVTYNNFVIKPQLELNTSATSYEPYCGGTASPNPSYPQAIKNVVGNVNIKIENKNLVFEQMKGYNILSDGTFSLDATYDIHIARIEAGKEYTINSSPNTFVGGFFYELPQSSSQSYNSSRVIDINTTFIAPITGYVAFRSIANYEKPYLEQGATPTDYVEHQEQNLPFTLEEGQKLMLGDTLEDNGIHHKRKQKIYDGTENWLVFSSQGKTSYYINLPDGTGQEVKCSHFICQVGGGFPNENKVIYNGNTNKNIVFYTGDTENKLTEWKAFLAEQYANGTPVIVEYELAEEEITAYTEAQATQYNAIQNAKTYKEQTNITTSSDELDPILKIQYYEVKEV